MSKNEKPMTRSENMARIKSKNTSPEIYLREILWNKGFRYLKNYKKLPGTPDIFIIRYNTVIFVNGCFWHMHEGCKNSNIPSSNREFWIKKLQGNVERDRKNYQKLHEKGIKVLVVWECVIRKMKCDMVYENIILEKISNFIVQNNDSMFLELE